MDDTPFVTQVLQRIPLIIIAPYGSSISEVANSLIESMHRSHDHRLPPIYNDTEYTLMGDLSYYITGPGIVFMTSVRDDILYTPDIIPIYIVSWGVREHNINRYRKWTLPLVPLMIRFPILIPKPFPQIIIYPVDPPAKSELTEQKFLNISYPKWAQDLADTDIWINDQVLTHLSLYSPKFDALWDNITVPCVIICPYIEKYGLCFIREIIRRLNIPIYFTEDNPYAVQSFIRNRNGILLTPNSQHLADISSSVPIHLLTLNSANGMELFLPPHHHTSIHIYLATSETITGDLVEYRLLSLGIQDASDTFTAISINSREIVIDTYNNLYVRS